MHIIIPTHHASKRFPDKFTHIINGKPLIQHVYERAKHLTSNVYIATDGPKVQHCAESFTTNIIQTGHHTNGTSRCYEAAQILALGDLETVIDWQADEPNVPSAAVQRAVKQHHATQVTTMHYFSLGKNLTPDDVKIIINKSGRAIFFTRHAISSLIHVGIYIYNTHLLRLYHQFGQSPMETAESLEQMRFIDNDIPIYSTLTSYPGPAINKPGDIKP